MLTKQHIKLIEILDDALTETINQTLVLHPEFRKNSTRFIDIVLQVLSQKFTDNYIACDEYTQQYIDAAYMKSLEQISEEESNLYKKMMLKISDSDLCQEAKLCFRKNEFKYLGDIALCSPKLLLCLADWNQDWHIPVRKELLKHGLDLCTKLKAWPMIRKEMST